MSRTNEATGTVILGWEEAMALLPDTPKIHTYRESSVALLGADWSRRDLVQAMKEAPEIHETGVAAQAFGHGMAIFDEHGPLFIETKRVKEELNGP